MFEDDPHAVPDVEKPFDGQLPEPSQSSVTSQTSTAPLQIVEGDALFAWHVPDPLHVSAPLHVVDTDDPHAAPSTASFARHVPEPSHESGSVHSVFAGEPHDAPDDA